MTQSNNWTDFQMPSRLNVEPETLTERYGKFHAAPFERGFGTTVGNSIRRALLSSIEGAAITAVKIDGVEHEFSSIKGVVEDATDVILNLKQVPFTLHGSGPKTLSNFAYASTLTESLLIANLALRTGKRIEWDAGAMRAKSCPEADVFIRPEFRAGWSI